MQEHIIVTVTSYGRRLHNLPSVIDSILKQTVQPDLIVLNFAIKETIPSDIQSYLKEHSIEMNRVPDTKVYKKLIPTLKKYPEACVISIDDDFLYPPEMIEEFLMIHKECPGFPISGNKVVYYGMQCHCGCASLTKADFLGDYLFRIDENLIQNCPSDDMVYTFFSTKNGHPYLHTDRDYFLNMESCNPTTNDGYSQETGWDKGIEQTYRYLIDHFGAIDDVVSLYIQDPFISKALQNILKQTILEAEHKVRSSHAYQIGKLLVKPIRWFKNIK